MQKIKQMEQKFASSAESSKDITASGYELVLCLGNYNVHVALHFRKQTLVITVLDTAIPFSTETFLTCFVSGSDSRMEYRTPVRPSYPVRKTANIFSTLRGIWTCDLSVQVANRPTTAIDP
jgi:hypothetical protein